MCVCVTWCSFVFCAARFPDVEIQRCAALALACIVVGPEMTTKMSIMADDGLLPLLALCACSDVECERAATFAIGCLTECPDVKGKIVELGGTMTLVQQGRADDLEVRRNCGYFLALLAEEVRGWLSWLSFRFASGLGSSLPLCWPCVLSMSS